MGNIYGHKTTKCRIKKLERLKTVYCEPIDSSSAAEDELIDVKYTVLIASSLPKLYCILSLHEYNPLFESQNHKYLTPLLKFVLISPGRIQFTRMPSDPSSFAKTFAKAKSAVLLIA